VELDLSLRIRDHRPERGLAARPRGRGHSDKRGDARRDRGAAVLVLDDRATVDDLDADRLRRVHRAPAAEGDETVAAGFDVRGFGVTDELDIRVWADLVEEDRVLEVRERRIGETGRDDSFVRDQKRPTDSQLRDELAQARDRARTMDDPG